MSLVYVHGRLANTALLYTIVLAAWGLWRFFRRQGVDSSYWGALVIGEVLFLAQGGLGLYMLVSGIGNLAGRYIHILYGVVSVLVIPGVFLFTRGEEQRRAMLIYGVALLFLVGILLRARFTAG
jgi:hypothetical protein